MLPFFMPKNYLHLLNEKNTHIKWTKFKFTWKT